LLKLLRKILVREPPRATEAETKVLGYLLSGDDSRYELLGAQLEYAPVLRSNPDPTSLVLSPQYTATRLRFPFELARLESPWVRVRDRVTDRILEFRVVVVRGGFLKSLEGRSADGLPWPREWVPDLSAPLEPAYRLALPAPELIEEMRQAARANLARWLQQSLPETLDTFPGATPAQIAARELHLGGRFPNALKDLFQISDGLESDDFRFLGHADAYPVDSRHLPALLLAWDSDDRDEFVVVVSLDGTDQAVYRLDVHVDEPVPEKLAADVREYLADRLKS
jgi:hypothetical protein